MTKGNGNGPTQNGTETEMTNEDFCNATSVWNSGTYGNEIAWVCEPEDVTQTAETVADFVAARSGKADEYATEKGTLYVWENQQSRAGKKRGNLFLMDAGDFRLSYFDGEA